MAENIINQFISYRPYRNWQYRIAAAIILGYATFYVVRLNFSIVIPSLINDYGFNKTQIGFILSFSSIVYGFGKFVFGYICDHTNPKWFLIFGLLGTAAINVLIPLTGFSGVFLICFLWGLNGCFQAMGWPACAKIITHWFNKDEIGTLWGICNSAHAIGSACIAVFGSYLFVKFGINSVFLVPGLFVMIVTLFLAWCINDLPHPQNHYQKKDQIEPQTTSALIKRQRHLLKSYILTNPIMWCLCLSNFFLYIVRIGLVSWIPTYLVEYRNASLSFAGWQLAGFEVLGILGGIIAGYLSDRIGAGLRPIVAIVFLLGLFVCLLASYSLPSNQTFLIIGSLMCSGFFIYGPQVLAGVIATDYVPKNIAATATGIIGTFGYIGASFSGVGIGWVVDNASWGCAFAIFTISSVFSMLFFCIALKIRKLREMIIE